MTSTTKTTPPSNQDRIILVTGGSRSGKSRHAEGLLAAEPRVRYLAPGPVPDPATDAEWAARIQTHRNRRAPHWDTVEGTDLAAGVRDSDCAVLIDDLGSWLTALIEELDGWNRPVETWRDAYETELTGLIEACRAAPVTVVAVTSEVGMGLVSEHRSGRVFTDLLGEVNQRLAEHCSDVILVVAGRAVRL